MAKFQLSDEQMEMASKLTKLQRQTVIGVINGLTQRKAYYAAGGTAKNEKSADAAVCRILADVRVKAFYESLVNSETESAVMSRAEAMETLSNIGRSKITDVVDFRTVKIGEDDNGKPVFQTVWTTKNGEALTPAQAALINEVNASKEGLKVKLHSQTDAIKQLAAMEGWNAPTRGELTGKDGGPIETTDVTPTEMARKIAFLLSQGVTVDAG